MCDNQVEVQDDADAGDEPFGREDRNQQERITHYRSRDGRTVTNDDNGRWLRPAFGQMYRLLKSGSFCVSFYGWNKADLFLSASRAAGFRIVGHIVFGKRYTSSVRFLRYQHEQAYFLVKGNATPPNEAAIPIDTRNQGRSATVTPAVLSARETRAAIRLVSRKAGFDGRRPDG